MFLAATWVTFRVHAAQFPGSVWKSVLHTSGCPQAHTNNRVFLVAFISPRSVFCLTAISWALESRLKSHYVSIETIFIRENAQLLYSDLHFETRQVSPHIIKIQY